MRHFPCKGSVLPLFQSAPRPGGPGALNPRAEVVRQAMGPLGVRSRVLCHIADLGSALDALSQQTADD